MITFCEPVFFVTSSGRSSMLDLFYFVTQLCKTLNFLELGDEHKERVKLDLDYSSDCRNSSNCRNSNDISDSSDSRNSSNSSIDASGN